MPRTEAPITSFFPKLSQSAKRKQSASHASQSTSRKRSRQTNCDMAGKPTQETPQLRSHKTKSKLLEPTSSLSSVSSSTPPPVWDIFEQKSRIVNGKRNKLPIVQTHSIISLHDDDSEEGSSSQTTPCMRNALHPVATIVEPTRSSAVQSPSILSVTPPDPKGETPERGIRRLPKETPACSSKYKGDSPVGKPLRSKNQQVNAVLSTVDTSMLPDALQDEIVADSQSDVEVLSSQTALRMKRWNTPQSLHELTVAYNPRIPPSAPNLGAERSNDSVASPLHTQNVTDLNDLKDPHCRATPECDSNDVAIPSSQTQHILLDYISPQRRRIYKRLCHVPRRLSTDNEDFVQSSQSQAELVIEEDQTPDPCLIPSSLFPSSSYKGGEPKQPVRTYSDALFSIPPQQTNLEELLRENVSPTLKKYEINTESIPIAESQESDTESNPDAHFLNSRSRRNAQKRRLPVEIERTHYSADESDNSSSDYGTLPDVVKDFRSMFDGDGSYPNDFPESLQ
ncbi:hypothetical protein AMATHDRAFT_2018 [Amanita thiersii Skay4041]|uniref:Uncharacterized protein n=1 Tax=Amanita thiersii Skay4041 TaxID=703135 RepID=A0A2A9NXU2_9AGAR|nr:hypothetical protein AMATHDRAFT_2018 [Amanita thiersii Skay4041]